MKLVRRLLERLSQHRILRRRFRLNGKSLHLYYSPDAQLKYLKGQGTWDTDLQEIAREHLNRESVVWDIGSNIGVFAFSAALMDAKSVFAFEPDIFLASVIERTVDRNALGHQVRVLPVALSNATGLAKFLIAGRGRASNALETAGGRSQMGGVRKAVSVPVFRGDDVANWTGDAPTFIKIDVEGAEYDVLQGLSDVLKKNRPTVYVEVGGKSKLAVLDLFDGLDYSVEANTVEQQNLLCVPK